VKFIQNQCNLVQKQCS